VAAYGDAGRWIRRFGEPRPGAPALVCFPHAGGSASFYFPLARRLGPAISVLGVQYPGRQDRRTERPAETIGELADGAVTELLARRERPVALFGHSMGALVAYEAVRRLEARGDVPGPAVLIVSGRRAPSRPGAETLHLKDDDGVLRELTALSGTDARVLGDEEMLRLILPAIRADYRALAAYAPENGARVAAPITALVGDADPVTTVEDAGAWADFTTSGFDLRVHPGGHFFLAERQATVAAEIRTAMKVGA
jgi:surfactin synthase thioesterase subunit